MPYVRKPLLRDALISNIKEAKKSAIKEVQRPSINEFKRAVSMPVINEGRKHIQISYPKEIKKPIIKEMKNPVINQVKKPAVKEVKKVTLPALSVDKKGYKFSYEHSQFIEEALYAHNICRQRHNVPLLKHNPDLSKMAHEYANYLARSRKLVHSHSTYKGESLGENLSYWYNNRIQKFSGIRLKLIYSYN